jgi:hydroxymethylpyrimidine pyrophosphatase-like HAD family hydrolase
MKSIGLRNIKTAIAVLITLMVALVLQIIDEDFASKFYSPFFASIAAVYSMQRESSKSFAQARIRVMGSIVGGLFGLVLIFSYETFLMDYLIENYSLVFSTLVLYLITAVFIIILIQFLVIFKVHDLVFVACLTYLSVMVSIRNNLPVILFAIDRILSTIIGVMIALVINNFKFFRFRNKNILFVSGLDECILNKEKQLTPFTTYQLTSLLNDGLNFTISTTRTPASLSKILKGIPLNNELMIMNGAVIYDIIHEKYLDLKFIEKSTQKGIDEYFAQKERNVFTYTIIDQALSIYHIDFENEAEEKFYLDRKNDYFRNHVKGKIDNNESVIFYILIDKLEVVKAYEKDLLAKYGDNIHCQIYEYSFFRGYYFLKIYTSKTSKKIALDEYLAKKKFDFVISFGSKEFDLELMHRSDFSCALRTASSEVKEVADLVLDSESPDDLLRLMKKIYYAANPKEYLHKVIKKNKDMQNKCDRNGL